ncbi:Uncharacterised protein [Mycolicibacterium fortuitum]|uniref:Uncharacterized protein n=1 Tax=Mycolicibacterium fortuitum TaxID=1766 RepID=A0A378WFB3_MYCFO|nr:Uncharacterised protein [Mycolicibacterium fortuitum]
MPDVQQFQIEPRVIEAVQWTSPEQGDHIARWCGGFYDRRGEGAAGPDGEQWGELTCETFAGQLTISPFDFVVDIAGDKWPCRPDALYSLTGHASVANG